MDPMLGFDIRLVFILLPRDSAKDAYTSEITFLALVPWYLGTVRVVVFSRNLRYLSRGIHN